MKYKFSNIDNELMVVQTEKLIYNMTTVKKKNIIKFKRSFRECLIKFFAENGIVDASDFKLSKDFYLDPTFVIECNYDEYSFDSNIIKKDDIVNLFFEQLEIYYFIYKLPKFNVDYNRLINYLNVLYDYVMKNNKGNFSSIITSISRFVFADALIRNKEITYSDFVHKLKYLTLFGFNTSTTFSSLSNI